MKKKTLTLSLLLALALVFGSFTSVFAGTGLPTEESKKAMEATGFQCVQKIHNEMNAEMIANTFAEEVVKGGYKTIDTAGVKRLLGKKNVIIIVI